MTNPTPTTTPNFKNPRRVAAGKLVGERTRRAREQQEKALVDAEAKIANNTATPVLDPEPATESTPKSINLSTTQWLMVASIVVGLAGIY